LADNAQFWVGESFMALNQYEQAILAYQKVIKNYPKGNKVPNAMLRQALAFHEIKDDISAKLLLRKVVKNYPDTSEAKIAEAKLKSFK
jgi:tol-pal system protein YbgF